MPKTNTAPPGVAAYLAHGVLLDRQDSGQAVGDCPFCGREGKFYVNTVTGLWDCKPCGAAGNPATFLRQLWEASRDAGGDAALRVSRSLLGGQTLTDWGLRVSAISGEILIPGYGAGGKLDQLYRYISLLAGRKPTLVATPGVGHGLFGVPLYDPQCKTVYVCEGLWNGMILWETLGNTKAGEDGTPPSATSARAASLLAETSVLAVPGANAFRDEWLPLLAGKVVYLIYDNDHARKHPQTGAPVPPAGREGCRRAARLLAAAEEPPAEIHFLDWAGGEGDYNPTLPSGYDVRDLLGAGKSLSERARLLGDLQAKLRPVPPDWIAGRSARAVAKGHPEIEPLECTDWTTLVTAWRKAMKWFPGIDRALAVMLASAASVRVAGEQLWVIVTSPPSGGKTSLCEGLSVAKRHVLAKSVIRGFHSGFQVDRSGSEDVSLLARLNDKTLVTKDGDTLLQSPNLPQILAEARDVYDRVSRTHYRNKMSKDYRDINMTWVLCGTSSLRALDDSELGQRFLSCVIMDRIDEDMEQGINLRRLGQFRNLMASAPGVNGDGADGPDMTLAKRLTGGYVGHLRATIEDTLTRITMSDAAARACTAYGTFVAYLRSRPSARQDEEVHRELSTRLVIQHAKLAYCLAAVLNRPAIDDEVLARVRQVALDTARGRTITLCRMLYAEGEGGATAGTLALLTGETDTRELKLLQHLRRIGAVERCEAPAPIVVVTSTEAPEGGLAKKLSGSRQKRNWRLTPRLKELWEEVVVGNSEGR